MEVQAPGIIGRQPVHEPLQTGIKAIDAMTPIGRGQRELIIGDRKTGKTTVAIDTIINQRGLGVKCIYVAIGQKDSTVAADGRHPRGSTAPSSTPSSWWPARPTRRRSSTWPRTPGCAMGQHWMDNGEHALIVYDDLSKQAEAYRQMSLLLRRPPGREAYPGDVFYLHSRLLERAAKLSDELGAGSPHRPAGHRDQGRRRLGLHPDQRDLHHRRPDLPRRTTCSSPACGPAINVGISVSRVGGAAQIKAMKTAVGSLKTDLAQFRELEAFAAFGSELDKVVPGPARPRLPAGRAAQAGPQLADAGRGPGASASTPAPAATSTACRSSDVRRFETELLEYFAQPALRRSSTASRRPAPSPDVEALDDRDQGLRRAVRRRTTSAPTRSRARARR